MSPSPDSSLPASAGRAVTPGLIVPPLPDHASAKAVHVLVAVRDDATRRLIGDWFTAHGYFVALANTTETGERVTHTLRFDLIVCDSCAASHHARHWLETLLTHPPCPTILLTTHPTLEAAIRVANQPLAAYLLQPVDLLALGRLVTGFLAQRVPHPAP